MRVFKLLKWIRTLQHLYYFVRRNGTFLIFSLKVDIPLPHFELKMALHIGICMISNIKGINTLTLRSVFMG